VRVEDSGGQHCDDFLCEVFHLTPEVRSPQDRFPCGQGDVSRTVQLGRQAPNPKKTVSFFNRYTLSSVADICQNEGIIFSLSRAGG